MRAYLNGQRVVDVNQVDAGGITHILAEVGRYRANGLRSVRVAESAPDFSTEISQTGKYVTHGIHFDTDSAILKPDSAAVLNQVANGLDKNPNLKLEIDGYTDSTANGFGADKPVGSNDTAEGRAQNRRVQFVKK